MRIVEVSIDLENPNEKIIFNFFEVKSVTEKFYVCSVDEWNRKSRRFDKNSMDKLIHITKLHIAYRFVENGNFDYSELIKSEKAKSAVSAIYERFHLLTAYWSKTLDNRMEYYRRNHREGCG